MFESVGNPIYGKLKRYWRGTNQYQRRVYDMDQSWSKKKLKVVYLGGGENKNKKRNLGLRRIRVIPKVRVILSPMKKLLAKIRDGYINMMLRLAGTSMGSSMNDTTVNAFLTKRIPKAREVVVNKNKITSATIADLDTKLVLEIYKLLIASRREQDLQDA